MDLKGNQTQQIHQQTSMFSQSQNTVRDNNLSPKTRNN